MSTATPAVASEGVQSSQRNSGLLRNSLIYGGASLVAYLLSMVKAIVVARLFGTSPEMDAFTLAILVPNLLGALLTGTTAGALVPILAKADQENRQQRATVFRSSFAVFALVCLALTAALALCVPLIAPHLRSFDPYRLQIMSRMLKTTSWLVFFTGIYAFCSAELLSRRRYVVVAAAPAVSTLFSLIVILAFRGSGIDVLVWSLVGGTLLQAVAIAIPAWNASSGGAMTAWNNRHVQRTITAQGALLGAAAVGVANAFIDQMFAAMLPAGSVSALSYANTLHGIAMQTAVMSLGWIALPELSELAAAGHFDALRSRIRYVLVLGVMITAPLTLGIGVFGADAVRIVFQHGKFDTASTHSVALAWTGYSLGLIPAACGMIVVRLLNALHENGLIFRVGVVLIVANAICDYVFLRIWGLFGISLSTSFVYCVSATLFLFVLRSRVGAVLDRTTVVRILSALISGSIAILPILLLKRLGALSVMATCLEALFFCVLVIAGYVAFRLVKVERNKPFQFLRLSIESSLL